MTPRLDGRTALITGAAHGIGAAAARRLGREGARVLVTDRDGEAADRAAAALRAEGLTAEAYACDVADRRAVEAAVTRAVELFDALDILVNSAASCSPDADRFEDESDESWALDLDVTLTGVFRSCRAALPHLAASGRGAIVNVGSVNGVQAFGCHAYSAAKAGLASLTRTLAAQVAPRGVRVNLVVPGTVRTTAWQGREAALEEMRTLYPLGRVGEPEDIAAAIAYLASPDAGWVTGTELRVDGGITIDRGLFRTASQTP